MLHDAWLSGFADGEGCFALGRDRALIIPAFTIKLRDDDGAVLRELQSVFGGRIHAEPRKSLTECPQLLWRVQSKADLPNLIGYFDNFRLRAKKARDYAVWREGVLIYIECGGRDPRLPALREKLMAGRRYLEAVA